jgi:hypothetical protein
MSTLTQASAQWMSRPDDERFTSLDDMAAHFAQIRGESRATVVPSRRLEVIPSADNRNLSIHGPNGHGYEPTHWAFGQLAERAGAPAGYLRTLPAPIAADALNYGLQFKRDTEDLGVLLQRNGSHVLRAVTGPNYGRIWNSDITDHLIARFGDGVTGEWRVPGEFRQAVTVTKANTTLYASDRDMFVFLANEENRIDLPNRRDGKPGSVARGFFVWNSEVGSATYGMATFLYDYTCSNRMVWGAQEFKEIRIRHTAGAPDRFLDEMRPALEAYAHSSAKSITDAIESARAARISGEDGKLDEFLAKRFGKRAAGVIQATHIAEEGRPIETLWDATVGATAYARNITWQDERVSIERKAGEILDLASK